MTEITINIPDSKLPFFMLLAKELNFVVVDEKKTGKKITANQRKQIADLQDAMKEVDMHMQGKIKLKSAQQFLDEL